MDNNKTVECQRVIKAKVRTTREEMKLGSSRDNHREGGEVVVVVSGRGIGKYLRRSEVRDVILNAPRRTDLLGLCVCVACSLADKKDLESAATAVGKPGKKEEHA